MHPYIKALFFMFLTLIWSDCYNPYIGLNLIIFIKFRLQFKNSPSCLNSVKNRHLNIHKNKFKLLTLTIFVITMTKITRCKLFNCLTTIASCGYIKQWFLDNFIYLNYRIRTWLDLRITLTQRIPTRWLFRITLRWGKYLLWISLVYKILFYIFIWIFIYFFLSFIWAFNLIFRIFITKVL